MNELLQMTNDGSDDATIFLDCFDSNSTYKIQNPKPLTVRCSMLDVFLVKMSTSTASVKDRIRPDTIIKNHYGGYQRHSPRFIVGYWSIRGLGAPIRMLLSAAQIDHWVVMYDVKDDCDSAGWDKSSWEADKAWLQKISPS